MRTGWIRSGAWALVAAWAAAAACSNGSDGDSPPAAPLEAGAGGNDGASSAEGGALGDAGATAPITPDLPSSGSRIQALYYETADGLRVFSRRIHDSLLDVDCTIEKYEDGVLRCVPSALTPGVGGVGGVAADCVTPVTSNASGCAPLKVALGHVADSSGCGRAVAYRIGAPAAPYQLATGADAGCQPVGATGADTYAVGAKLAPSELVAFHLEETVLSDRFAAPMFVGDDGARVPVHMSVDVRIDRARGKGCWLPRPAADDKMHCTPLGASALWADSTCTTRAAPIGDAPSCDDGLPRYDDLSVAVDRDPSGTSCSPLHVFTTGAPLSASAVYDRTNDGGCGPGQSWDAGILAVGAELPPATFPELAEGSYGGRLQMRFYTAAGVTMMSPRDRVFDRQLDTVCAVHTAADGRVRCVPEDGWFFYGDGYFADAACTQRVLFAPPRPACQPPARYARAHADCDGAGPVRSYALGDAFPSPPTLYQLQGGTCVSRGVGASDKEYRPVVRELDPNEMAAVTVVAR